MDYEKKYNETLERAKSIKDSIIASHNKESASYYTGIINNIFPELADSEDEKIRKQIEQALIEHDWSATYKVSKDDCLAYLEKQKEQKPLWSEEDEEMLEDIKFNFVYNKEKMTDALIAQYNRFFDKIKSLKPQPRKEWSEKDDYRIRWIISLLTTMREKGIDDRFGDSVPDDIPDMIAWLKSLYERFNLQAKREWNEEEVPDETKQECGSIDVLSSIKTSHIETLKNLLFYFKGERKSTREEINTSFIPCLEYLLKDAENTNDRTEWSKEDEEKRKRIILLVEHAIQEMGGSVKHEEALEWLKSLRPQPHWKQSLATVDLENDLCYIQDNYSDCSHEYKVLGEAIEFIRSTESHWKPSEEQMKLLFEAQKALLGKDCHNRFTDFVYELKRVFKI